MIAVLHAYSRVNAGDGLLVDLTLERLAGAGVPAADCVVFALDPASFADLPRVRAVGTPGRAVDRDLAVGAGRAAGLVGASRHGRLGTAAGRDLAAADAYVGVGGGYLRAGTATNAVGTAVNHLPQLAAAARTGQPIVYLPVSVGPLAGPVGAALRRLLGRAAAVHVRDDRSLTELAGLANVVRTPDLVVLDVADRGVAGRAADGPPVLVARALTDAPGHEDRLRALAERLGDVVWAVQAEGRSEKSDRAFYERAGIPAGPPLADVLAAGGHGPVVSVRLHGALAAVRAGVPAVHLGYERKSWGAYADLDLDGWVHDARRFDPDAVAAQVAALRADPSPFWAAAEAAAGRLRERSEALTSDLADRLRDGPAPRPRRRRRTPAAPAGATAPAPDGGGAPEPGRRLRALLLTTTLPAAPGDGTPAFVLDLAVALGRDHDVTVLAPRVRGAAPAGRVGGVTVVRFPYFPRRLEGLADGAILPNLRAEPWRVVEAPFLVAAFWLAARRLARATGADVVNAHWIVPAGIVARLLQGRGGPPYVVTAHGADAYALGGRLPGAVKRWVLRGAATTLPVSRDIAARLGDGAGPVVPMGVDVAALAAATGGRAPEPGRLLFVGRLAEKKGVDVLLDALPGVPAGRLVVVGDGPDRAALERRAADRGVADRVTFRGQLPADAVVAELRRAAALVIPSRVAADGDTDGTPVVLGEAMAAGVPVVASRLGGLGEQLEDGVTGLLVPPGDPDALAAALLATLDDPAAAEARAVAARAAAAERLDVRAVAARYGEVLAAAAAGQRLAGST